MKRFRQSATRIGAIACIVLTMSSQAFPSPPRDQAAADRLEAVAASYTPNSAFMGAVLVARGDQILLDKGFGFADLEWLQPNSGDVKFRIGSLTKQFTAALVLIMQEERKLDIRDTVGKYIPDMNTAWSRVTISELLGHTSGIPDFTEDSNFRSWAKNTRTWAQEFAFFKDKPLNFEPGSKFQYSSTNYELLGEILEAVSGVKYETLLKNKILDPLEMKETGLDSDDLILPERAQGYRLKKTGLAHADSISMSVPWAAGSIYSTTHDLLLWERALFAGKVLSAASLEAMTAPGQDGFGFGVKVSSHDGHKLIDHGGSIEGFDSEAMILPDRQIIVVVLSNVSGLAPGIMAGQLLDVALGDPVVLPSERVVLPISQNALEKFQGTYDLNGGLVLSFSKSGTGLVMTAQGKSAPAEFVGIRRGHPFFYVPMAHTEAEFIPNSTGGMTSLIWHQNGDEFGTRR